MVILLLIVIIIPENAKSRKIGKKRVNAISVLDVGTWNTYKVVSLQVDRMYASL